ncbi:MAG TPA: WXG100 family type VII secretion target, partial [Candidatus Dormibacteraeota bacterium]|nr:WXG100 family type VII secretion target [Candidatus Dormibacteraeota bacterium]
MSPPVPAPTPSPSAGPSPPPPPPKVERQIDIFNPGGHPETLTAAAEAWRTLARGLRAVEQDIGTTSRSLRGGWTGQASDGFQAWAAQLRKDLGANAGELDRIAGQLDQVAAEIRSKNAQIHELYVAMGVTAAIGLGLAIFTWGFSTAAAADAAVAEG